MMKVIALYKIWKINLQNAGYLCLLWLTNQNKYSLVKNSEIAKIGIFYESI